MTEKDFNSYGPVIEEMHKLSHMSVSVGVFNGKGDEDYLEMIAMVNEYGTHIFPRKAKWLTIPTKLAGKRSAREIEGLFVPKGKHCLAKTNSSGGLDVYFWLKKSVVIPERSYFRSTYDQKLTTDWEERMMYDASKISVGEMTAKELYEDLGRLMVKDVQATIAKTGPGNAPATIERKGKNNPLIDTGGLYRAISWVVDE